MKLRRDKVPDGPPVRWAGCTKDCETRWDREPRHSEECRRRGREANERIRVMQEETDAQIREYLDYRVALRADTAQPVAPQAGIVGAEPDGDDGHTMGHTE